MKTSELSGTALDWAVAKAEGWTITTVSDKKGQYLWLVYGINEMKLSQYRPSTNWMRGGPIIEREKIGVWWATHFVDDEGLEYGNHWYAEYGVTDESADKTYQCQTGTTPLTAAMRCYVASKLGDEVELPEDLTNE